MWCRSLVEVWCRSLVDILSNVQFGRHYTNELHSKFDKMSTKLRHQNLTPGGRSLVEISTTPRQPYRSSAVRSAQCAVRSAQCAVRSAQCAVYPKVYTFMRT